MSCHGFLVAAPGGGGRHRPSIPVALIAQRALHAVASAQPMALPLPPPHPPPPPSMPPPPPPPQPPNHGHLLVQCPTPRGIRPHSVGAETGPKDNKDHGGSADDPTQGGSAEVLRRQHLARQKQRTHQNGGKAIEVPSGRTVLGTRANRKATAHAIHILPTWLSALCCPPTLPSAVSSFSVRSGTIVASFNFKVKCSGICK